MRDMVSDETLALAASEGDREAFSQLLSRVYDRVFALAFRLTGSRAEAEDLTQDICAALPVKLRGFDARARLTTWLYRVVVNAAHDRRRRAASHARAAVGWGDVELARRAEADETRDQLGWLAEAMLDLPEDLRETLVLVLEPLTHAEVAEIQGISEGTVSWRMSEIRKRLKARSEAER
ncbi:RNA polymerase sigma factor [Marinovum sp. 2_MG-2023]|uniref:RNA polymerase sigma factor n=1 Tax=unclassified Marinovum TaxID=2647166 RepID=UPI0026E3CFAB|nr:MULTISPECIES: RNA polymerase sigma factor [unclassified Marinovum]MDO6730160.1 RNA polymerase sigma factor [Marinovum sp. 2_MG-2023]MDO6778898.1 RNA polymerase sigma factor [Marinovum sp. 1_MG-2023]